MWGTLCALNMHRIDLQFYVGASEGVGHADPVSQIAITLSWTASQHKTTNTI